MLRSDLIAKAGDVVTTESGKFVCRVAKAIRRSDVIQVSQFVGWAIDPPKSGAPILRDDDPWIWRKPDGGFQLHVNGSWTN